MSNITKEIRKIVDAVKTDVGNRVLKRKLPMSVADFIDGWIGRPVMSAVKTEYRDLMGISPFVSVDALIHGGGKTTIHKEVISRELRAEANEKALELLILMAMIEELE